MSELYHMSDVVEIIEREGVGRMVALIGSQLTTSPTEDEVCALIILLMCSQLAFSDCLSVSNLH